MFEEGKPNWYKVKTAVENDWLNQKLDNFNYGKYYSVLFHGDAETYLWQTKEAPEVDKEYYGHMEPTKSGKGMRFKKDKVDSTGPVPVTANEKQASFVETPEKQNSINKAVALNNAVNLYASSGGLGIDILKKADEFYAWLSNETVDEEEEESEGVKAVRAVFNDQPEYTEEDM